MRFVMKFVNIGCIVFVYILMKCGDYDLNPCAKSLLYDSENIDKNKKEPWPSLKTRF